MKILMSSAVGGNTFFGIFLVLILLAPAGVSFAMDPISEAEDLRNPNSQTLVLGAQSKISRTRARVALALGRIQKPDSVNPLLKLLNDASTRVLEASIFGLGQLGWDENFSGRREAEIVLALKPFLSHRDGNLRQIAVEAIGKIGLQETPALVQQALFDKKPEVRAEAVLALYRYRLVLRLRNPSLSPGDIPDLPSQSLDRLNQLASDSSLQVQKNVAYFFARVKDPRGIPSLVKLSQHGSKWVRYFSIVGLGKQGVSDSTAIIEVLQRSLRDPVAPIRVGALQAMDSLKLEGPLPEQLASDRFAAVRAAYVQVLKKEETSTVLKLWKDPSAMVRSEVLKLAARTGDVSLIEKLLDDAVSSSDWVMREAAVAACTAEVSCLQRLEKDPDVRVRSAVLVAYGGLTDSESMNAIAVALKSDSLAERGSAVDALMERGEEKVLLLAGDCYLNSSGEKWTELRENLVAYMVKQKSKESTEFLKKMALDSSSSISQVAIGELKKRGIVDLPSPPNPTLTFSPFREIRFNRNPIIVFQTERGIFEIELFHKDAPVHVANMVGFAEKGSYDGLPIHRVVPNFVIQGGDPDGTGWGSAGYSLRAEINSARFLRGFVGMPRSTGFDTGGVQFFITHLPTPHLDGQYTVFGKVIRGLKVIDAIEKGDRIRRVTVFR